MSNKGLPPEYFTEDHESDGMFPERRRHAKKSSASKIFAWLLTAVFWAALVYGGHWYMDARLRQHQASLQEYVDSALRDVQETNALNVQSLEGKLQSLAAEMRDITDALEQADETISTSNTARAALNVKIEELNRQLEDLRQSLDNLKELNNGKK